MANCRAAVDVGEFLVHVVAPTTNGSVPTTIRVRSSGGHVPICRSARGLTARLKRVKFAALAVATRAIQLNAVAVINFDAPDTWGKSVELLTSIKDELHQHFLNQVPGFGGVNGTTDLSLKHIGPNPL